MDSVMIVKNRLDGKVVSFTVTTLGNDRQEICTCHTWADVFIKLNNFVSDKKMWKCPTGPNNSFFLRNKNKLKSWCGKKVNIESPVPSISVKEK